MRTYPGPRASRDRVVALASALVLALSVTGCGGGGGAEVPEGWTPTADDDLTYAVPTDAVASDPPVDPQARTEHVIGDPDDLLSPYIATYRSAVLTDAGDRADAATYAAELFGIEGNFGGLEDFTSTSSTAVEVPGAVEAERLQVRYEDPTTDDTVVQDVLIVVTDEHIYDLRFARVGDEAVTEEDVDALFGSVAVEG